MEAIASNLQPQASNQNGVKLKESRELFEEGRHYDEKCHSDSEGYLLSKGYSYYVFILLFLLYIFDYVDRMVVVSLFPFLQNDWGLSDTQCGMLVSAVYWSIVLFSFPISLLIDRWSRKKSIGFMAVLWSLATVACAFTGNFANSLWPERSSASARPDMPPAARP